MWTNVCLAVKFAALREWLKPKSENDVRLMNNPHQSEPHWLACGSSQLIRQILEDPSKSFPDFYIACGLQDVLLEANRSIAAALKEAGADVVYEDGEGIHDWIFWDNYIRHVLKWLDIDMEGRRKQPAK